MANTKKLSKDERQKAKRASRRALSDLYMSLTKAQRVEFKKSNKGIKRFIAEQKKEG